MLLLIHIYEDGVAGCETLNEVLFSVAAQFPRVRVARVKSSVLETSARFVSFAVRFFRIDSLDYSRPKVIHLSVFAFASFIIPVAKRVPLSDIFWVAYTTNIL